MIKIAPSILSADFANMGRDVEELEIMGADLIHCDVMDGVFVPNITFGIPMIRDIKKYTSLPLDVHLMIVEPEKYVKRFIVAGADIVTFHPEVSTDPQGCIDLIHLSGAKAGIVVNPEIEIASIVKYLPHIEMLLLMSVHPGFGGQTFIVSVLDKITEAVGYIKELGLNIDLEIDGGINEQNAKEVLKRGVNVLVAGNTIFKAKDKKQIIAALRSK